VIIKSILNEFTEGAVTKEKGRLFRTLVILKLNISSVYHDIYN